jgi:hypothetical protein
MPADPVALDCVAHRLGNDEGYPAPGACDVEVIQYQPFTGNPFARFTHLSESLTPPEDP